MNEHGWQRDERIDERDRKERDSKRADTLYNCSGEIREEYNEYLDSMEDQRFEEMISSEADYLTAEYLRKGA